MARATLLSPARYMRMGYGLELPTGYTLSQLRSALVRAQNQVNRYCNTPQAGFDWRGGAMLNEQHAFKIVNPLAYGPGARRVYTNLGPIKSVISLQLDLGRTYQVTIDPTTGLYINSIEQYVEIVTISPTIVGYYPLGISMGLYEPVAKISYNYGWTYPVLGDVLEAESPTVFTASYGNWDTTVIPVIEVGGVEVVPASIDYDDGAVTLSVAPSPGQEVTASYTYLAPAEVVDAVGLTATDDLVRSRLNQRGMAGLSNLKVAEVSMTMMTPRTERNGAVLPAAAADLLGGYVMGSVQS